MKLLIITSYPQKGMVHCEKTVGGASYTKTILTQLKKQYPHMAITVLAEQFGASARYEEEGILVERMWRRGDLGSLVRLFLYAYRSSAQRVIVSLEGYMFGSKVHTVFSLVCLLLLKLLNKKIDLFLHQVVADMKPLTTGKFSAWIMNCQRAVFYWLLTAASTRMIVFEQHLAKAIRGRKTSVIPHVVFPAEPITKKAARQQLGWKQEKKYVLYFGFLAPYKGIDWLIDTWPEYATSTLVIAGGPNPNHAKNRSMQQFVSRVLMKAKARNMHVTGFVPQEQIPLYFAACDVVIFPYKLFFSSSGPLALAFTYKRPVILSHALAGYQYSQDIAQALQQIGISLHAFTFSFTQKSLVKALEYAFANEKKLSQFAASVAQARSLKNIAAQYYNVLSS